MTMNFPDAALRLGDAAPSPTPETGGGSNYASYDPVRGHGTAFYGRHNTAADYDEANDDNVLATLRSPTGSPVVGRDPQPTDRVMVNGMETTVAQAERLGLITRNDFGRYQSGATVDQFARGEAKAAEAQAEAERKEADSSLEGFSDPAHDSALAAMVAATSPGAQIGALADIVHRGEMLPGTVSRLADEMGVQPAEAAARIEAVHEAFAQQAAEAVQAMGVVDPVAFHDWAMQNHPGQLKQAMERQVRERTTVPYRELATRYLQATEGDMTADLLNAECGGGISVFKTGSGQVALRFPNGMEVGYQAALKAGLIKVSRR